MTDKPYKAQFGEDRFLDEYFAHKRDGFYIEVGAYDGVKMSNTYFFEQQGWRGLLVEADPELAQRCRDVRPRSTIVNCAVVSPEAPPFVTFCVSDEWKSLSSLSFDQARKQNIERLTGGFKVSEITVPGKTLDAILDEHEVGRIDFLTIDVEGHEWDVLRGFTLARWRPEVVILERNTMLPDLRIVRHMFAHGYAYERTTGVNDWFVFRELAAVQRAANLVKFGATLYVELPARKLYKEAKKRVPVRTLYKRLRDRLR